ncbi:MAG: nucleotidyltransferase domain-containing protein [Gallionella sp.]|jgi:predicted nucleotidyltransferase
MRITQRQRTAIVDATREIFGDQSSVRLFGSRADDSALGGDIDLHVQIRGTDAQRQEKSRKLSARICAKLGDVFPIDVVVKDDATADELIHQEGMKGILL